MCLALMVLGGDPQMAYHAGLLAGLLAWFRRRAVKSQKIPPPDGPQTGTRPRMPHAVVLLAIAAAAGMLLSAVQIVPARRPDSR